MAETYQEWWQRTLRGGSGPAPREIAAFREYQRQQEADRLEAEAEEERDRRKKQQAVEEYLQGESLLDRMVKPRLTTEPVGTIVEPESPRQRQSDMPSLPSSSQSGKARLAQMREAESFSPEKAGRLPLLDGAENGPSLAYRMGAGERSDAEVSRAKDHAASEANRNMEARLARSLALAESRPPRVTKPQKIPLPGAGVAKGDAVDEGLLLPAAPKETEWERWDRLEERAKIEAAREATDATLEATRGFQGQAKRIPLPGVQSALPASLGGRVGGISPVVPSQGPIRKLTVEDEQLLDKLPKHLQPGTFENEDAREARDKFVEDHRQQARAQNAEFDLHERLAGRKHELKLESQKPVHRGNDVRLGIPELSSELQKEVDQRQADKRLFPVDRERLAGFERAKVADAANVEKERLAVEAAKEERRRTLEHLTGRPSDPDEVGPATPLADRIAGTYAKYAPGVVDAERNVRGGQPKDQQITEGTTIIRKPDGGIRMVGPQEGTPEQVAMLARAGKETGLGRPFESMDEFKEYTRWNSQRIGKERGESTVDRRRGLLDAISGRGLSEGASEAEESGYDAGQAHLARRGVAGGGRSATGVGGGGGPALTGSGLTAQQQYTYDNAYRNARNSEERQSILDSAGRAAAVNIQAQASREERGVLAVERADARLIAKEDKDYQRKRDVRTDANTERGLRIKEKEDKRAYIARLEEDKRKAEADANMNSSKATASRAAVADAADASDSAKAQDDVKKFQASEDGYRAKAAGLDRQIHDARASLVELEDEKGVKPPVEEKAPVAKRSVGDALRGSTPAQKWNARRAPPVLPEAVQAAVDEASKESPAQTPKKTEAPQGDAAKPPTPSLGQRVQESPVAGPATVAQQKAEYAGQVATKKSDARTALFTERDNLMAEKSKIEQSAQLGAPNYSRGGGGRREWVYTAEQSKRMYAIEKRVADLNKTISKGN